MGEKLKILYIAGDFSSRASTAAQVRALALTPELQKSSEFQMIAFIPDDEQPYKENGVTFLHKYKASFIQLAVATVGLKPRAFARFDSQHIRVCLSEHLLEFRPDVIHFDGFATLGLLKTVQKNRPEAKIIAHIHDAQSAFLLRNNLRDNLSVLYKIQNYMEYLKAKHFERNKLPNIATTIVDSDEDRDYLNVLIKKSSVTTLPLGFDDFVYKTEGPKIKLNQPAIIFSGSMKGRQSEDGALFLTTKIMPLVWARFPDANLYIVGGDPTMEIMSQQTERVHVTGFVEDLASYLRSAFVYACPLRLGSGMRTRVVEALACGTPMVATPMAMRGLLKPEDGLPWLTAESPEEFAVEIIKLLEGEYSDLGKQAGEYAKTAFSWNSVAKQLVKLYEDCTQVVRA